MHNQFLSPSTTHFFHSFTDLWCFMFLCVWGNKQSLEAPDLIRGFEQYFANFWQDSSGLDPIKIHYASSLWSSEKLIFILDWTIGLLKKLNLITTPFIPLGAIISCWKDWNSAGYIRNIIQPCGVKELSCSTAWVTGLSTGIRKQARRFLRGQKRRKEIFSTLGYKVIAELFGSHLARLIFLFPYLQSHNSFIIFNCQGYIK